MGESRIAGQRKAGAENVSIGIGPTAVRKTTGVEHASGVALAQTTRKKIDRVGRMNRRKTVPRKALDVPRSKRSLRNRRLSDRRRATDARAETPRGLLSFCTAALGAVSTFILSFSTLLFSATPAFASGALELIPDISGPLPIMLILFVLLIFPLNALIFKPIFSALDARAERIAGARERSKHLQRDADDVLNRYETAIREARSESEATRQAKLETAREEQVRLTAEARGAAESEIERARQELDQSIDEARATLRSSAESLAQAAAERVLGRTLS